MKQKAQEYRIDAAIELDPQLAHLILSELNFQRSVINLTAASNYLSPLVASAMCPELSNIHCEGYPGKRFHHGQDNADAIERLAVQRACKLFKADHANVQPYRCTLANLIASVACVPTGGTILGFACKEGGHYSTGSDVHITGQLFNLENYQVDPHSHELDYANIEAVAQKTQPHAIVGGDTAYPGTWDWQRMRAIADKHQAVLIADISQTAGLVAAGVLSSPIPHADIVTLSTYKTLRGPRAALILSSDKFKNAIDRAVFPVVQDGTNLMSTAGIAAALHEASQPAFATYCRQVVANARALADGLKSYGYPLITGTTRNHACLINLTDYPFTSCEAAASLARTGIICNSNVIPFDTGSPLKPNGLRVGTAAVTTVGMKAVHMEKIAGLIHRTLQTDNNESKLAKIAREVAELRNRLEQRRNGTTST